MRLKKALTILVAIVFIFRLSAQDVLINPLLPSGADPWSIYHKGYYYYTHTTGNNVTVWKTKSLSELKNAPKKTVFLPPPGTGYSKGLWAPEIHYINHRWYIYVAADSGKNESHRLYVLENKARDPFKGKWVFKGQLKDPTNKWAIDGSVFKHKGQLYLLWSGWEGNANGEQDIYISKMKNPWTLEGNRVRISSPVYDWETHGDLHDAENPPHVSVNEGPEFLAHGNKMFIVYSASGCWTDYYGLGMLTADASADLLDSASWKKSATPVFVTSLKNKVYAPGHNSFFKSPNGKEDWILYHANSAPGQGCGRRRSPRAQPFTWNADDTPNFGEPVAEGVKLKAPGR